MLLKNRRQVDLLGRRSLRIVQHSEEDMMLQRAGIRFDALQNAGMKRMEKITVAQEKANNFGAALKNSSSLRVGAEPKAADGFVDTGARLAAHLRAGIQHTGNCSYAHAGSAGYVANRALAWNCFQRYFYFLQLSHLSSTLLGSPVRASVAHL